MEEEAALRPAYDAPNGYTSSPAPAANEMGDTEMSATSP